MKQIGHLKSLVYVVVLAVMTAGLFAVFAQNTTKAGTEISNVAKAIYKGGGGESYSAVSQLVSFNIRAVSSLIVTPDSNEPSDVVASNELITRQFRICNTSNAADTYTITNSSISSPAQIVALYFDIDGDGLISGNDLPIFQNRTQSPVVQPGSCVTVLADISTRNIAIDERLTIGLTARSNVTDAANGVAEDSGTIINTTGKNAVLTDSNDPSLIPFKTVENVKTYVSSKNEPLDYVISFRNSGDVPAKNVVLTDDLPPQLSYIAGTLRVNGAQITDADDADQGSVVGNRLVVRFADNISPGEIVNVSFQALITGNQISGQGIINVAQIGGSNTAMVETTQAIAVIDPFGVVYAARGGSGSPISGASVVISTDANVQVPLAIPQNQGFDPNFANTNPYSTTPQGRYSFGLSPDQLGTINQPATYFMMVSAPNFRSRLFQISLSPNGNGLFTMIVRAMDGLPLANAGAFDLTQNDVRIDSIADIAFNVPMFESSTLEITKTADRIQAELGDVITYRVELHNASVAALNDVVVNDNMPDSFSYAPNTSVILRGGVTSPLEPLYNGNILQFRIGKLASGERVSLIYRARIGVNVRPGENFNSAVSSGVFPSGEVAQTGIVRAGIRVDAGAFSMKQIIIGRVFVDNNANNLFEAGELPVVGARIYLANGNSAVTDSQGLYSIPAVSEGAQVIAIDPVTLPQGYALQDNNVYSGKSWTRLLRTPLGGGGLLRQNFALAVTKETTKPVEQIATGERVVSVIGGQSTRKEPLPDGSIVKAKAVVPVSAQAFKPVVPGDVVIHAYIDNSVVMSAAANVEISVALNWRVELELNGQKVTGKSIGSTREDRKNQITSYTYIGLGLKPGPNKLTATAVDSNGQSANSASITLFGRGPAKTLEVLADSKEIQASGKDMTRVFVRALDAWSNPAQDLPVMLETSAGRFTVAETAKDSKSPAKPQPEMVKTSTKNVSNLVNSDAQINRQQTVNLFEGMGVVNLISDAQPGTAVIKASTGSATAETRVYFSPESRPGMLVSLAEVTVGKNAPEMQNRGVDDQNVRSHVQLYYRGTLFDPRNIVTLAYDSQQPLNRVAGRDRLFQLNPLDRVYPIFGDNSLRFQETESNSKVYVRFERGRSYALFGDFSANMENSRLLNYGRRLTGVKLHLENNNGDFVTATGARPDTSFARQVIPGGTLGIVQLAFPEVMPGSEYFVIETRDRRTPDLILSRETLARGLDYNIDTSTGTVYFLRPIPTFDRDLNLVQVVATYEYRSNGLESSVYTARAGKNFNRLGLRIGGSFLEQRQADSAPFRLGGVDLSLKLPNRGKLEAEFAVSRGQLNNGFSFFGNSSRGNQHDGSAVFVRLEQPIDYKQTVLRFEGTHASEGFFNPFGATVAPGNTRGTVTVETKPTNNSTLKVNLIEEFNKTENVDNTRFTAGINWTQTINEKIRLNLGYDFRRFSDKKNDSSVTSNLLTFGAEFKPTEKLDFAIKREQNLGEADPSYPNQTMIQANYRLSNWSKLFFTQRFSNSAITPISDVSGTGFSFSKARNETAVGVETQFGKYTSMSGRYQLENGINGTDSFAVVGLQNRLPVSKTLSVDLGYERAFHLAGLGKSYNNFVIGANYLPNDSFRSSVRYELRDRDGIGQVLTLGAAGELKKGWTALARFQYGKINFEDRLNRVLDGQVAMAIRPHDSDKYGLLFAYSKRDSTFAAGGTQSLPTVIKSDIISVDGFHQTTKRLELYGRFALKFAGDGNTYLPYADNLTYLAQGRAQYQLGRYFDVAAEGRYLFQPSSGSRKQWYGVEGGYWVLPDIRLGIGYNFSRSQEPFGFNNNSLFNRNGVYFTLSSKLSRLFNLFGTKKDNLQYYEEEKNKESGTERKENQPENDQ